MEENKNQLSSIFKTYLKSLLFEFVISMALLLILSIVLSKTNVSETIIKPTIIAMSGFCIILGSFSVSRKIDMKGIILRCNKWLYLYVFFIFNF